jgi:predicted MFS family arabinose efflux permease
VRRLLFLVGGVVFVDTMFFAALTPLLPGYADRFDLSKAGAGVLAGAYPIGVLIAGIPGGIATARYGARRVTITGALVTGVATFVFATADSIVVLDAARFTQGIGSALTWAAGLTWLVGETPATRRGQTIGTALAFAIVGALFGPVLGGVASVVGQRIAFGGAALLSVALAVWAYRTSAPPPVQPQPLTALLRALRRRRILLGVWFVVLPALFFGTVSVLAPLRLDELGFSALAIGALWLFTASLEATANPLVGRITDRVGRLGPMTVLALVSAVASAGLPWPGRAAVLAALVVIASMTFGSFWTPAMALLSDEAEARGLEYAYVFALINVAWAPGQALGAVGGGALAELSSDALPYLALAGASLITFGVLWRFRSSS